MSGKLEKLEAGMAIPYGGDRFAVVGDALAGAFRPGDSLIVVQETGDLLHVPAGVRETTAEAVRRAHSAFESMTGVSDAPITRFFDIFAGRLADDAVWEPIAAANAEDVAAAKARGRSTTRLAVGPKMRQDMIAGLVGWRDAPAARGKVVERVEHPGFRVEQFVAPLGVVGFVFEGRPNVFADAAGVLRSGNTAVFRIGSDALGTAKAIARHALGPALAEAGLPAGAAVLLESADRSAGWAMFSDRRLALAVARGSGPAVAQLGAVARQSGVPVSLHGTGGAWLIADESAPRGRFSQAVFHSLDRKVCNTLNVCCITRAAAPALVPRFLDALWRAGERRGAGCKLHVVQGDEAQIPEAWRRARVRVRRADGDHDEPLVEIIPLEALAREWEWEETPEVSLKLVEDVEEAALLFNRFSPRLAACVISENPASVETVFAVSAPFVGDGFTRWVDGQYALSRPELGLSNWEHGRLFARGAVLSGDGVYTIRTRMNQADPSLDRSGDAPDAPDLESPLRGPAAAPTAAA